MGVGVEYHGYRNASQICIYCTINDLNCAYLECVLVKCHLFRSKYYKINSDQSVQRCKSDLDLKKDSFFLNLKSLDQCFNEQVERFLNGSDLNLNKRDLKLWESHDFPGNCKRQIDYKLCVGKGETLFDRLEEFEGKFSIFSRHQLISKEEYVAYLLGKKWIKKCFEFWLEENNNQPTSRNALKKDHEVYSEIPFVFLCSEALLSKGINTSFLSYKIDESAKKDSIKKMFAKVVFDAHNKKCVAQERSPIKCPKRDLI